MTEDFLHYVWKFRLLRPVQLFTSDGEPIEIIKPGFPNTDAGPDFFNAILKIGQTKWAGNIEIHVRSSDWNAHSHSSDPAYDNVILHVVYENDCKITRKNGETITVLELKEIIPQHIHENYLQFINSKQWISCSGQIKHINETVVSAWLQRLMIDRLEKKSQAILNALQLNNHNWQETFYQQLVRNFGFQLNNLPFELLSKSLPYPFLLKHRDHQLQLEAMLFGQAGMLEKNFNDEYPLHLKKEYEFLKKKFKLKPIESHLWKFLRLRPVSFPTIRIAQLADLISKSDFLFSKILECNKLEEFQKLFNAVAGNYWDNHYNFDKASTKINSKILGKASVNILLINTVVTFLFVYGQLKQDEKFKEKSLNLLEMIPIEQNSIIRNWMAEGLKVQNAFQSQGLLELKNNFCVNRKCLQCNIGNQILKG
jgi:hypothetical protein